MRIITEKFYRRDRSLKLHSHGIRQTGYHLSGWEQEIWWGRQRMPATSMVDDIAVNSWNILTFCHPPRGNLQPDVTLYSKCLIKEKTCLISTVRSWLVWCNNTQSCIYLSLKTCWDVKQKAGTWTVISTKLTVPLFHFYVKFAVKKKKKLHFYSYLYN